jgi:ATP-dependent RNA helicase HelY
LSRPRYNKSRFYKRKKRPSQNSGPGGGHKPDSRQVRVFKPRVHAALQSVLSQIGAPEKSEFIPDPFQVEAVDKLARADVVVSAPTGSGKTWIAEQAIKRALESGQRAWYASPLKALSNAKYFEFGELFGQHNVGILTGDRKENTHAPLVVGTTEILRNQLYDAMYRGKDLNAGLVVLDEAHYLGDPDRGVVWEEVIIYLPVRVRLLLLSATVENADQIARWLHFVRGEPSETVISDERPVPLFPSFMFPDGELTPLRKGHSLFPKVRHLVEKDQPNGRRGPVRDIPPVSQVLTSLDHADLLPAIFFLKSRNDCDAALGISAGADIRPDEKRSKELNRFVDEFMKEFPFLAGHPQLGQLRSLQLAAHHAGHLPHWKLLVERLMQKGLLRAIFSTSTVAAGVNFPARTVVVTQSDRFNGREFVELRATDLLQMTGRAGRRGMDKIGFCLTLPGPYNDVALISGLLHSSPEPIESQLSINFSMVLNLLLSQKPAEVKQLLSMSFATFQRKELSGEKDVNAEASARNLLNKLTIELKGSSCPGPGGSGCPPQAQPPVK